MGTFANGRVEEFYECDPISVKEMRDLGVPPAEGTAQCIARRMRELHEVPLEVMRTVLEQGDLKAPSAKGFGRGIENHVMAASHRPRRRARSPRPISPGSEPTSPEWQNYNYFAHPSPRLITRHGNASTMSFDSLATSYDSAASFDLIGSPLGAGGPTGTNETMSPLALGPSSAPQTFPHEPYPGVWRRLKRWMREASKVLEMVNTFLATPEGRTITSALALPAQLPISVGSTPRTPPCTAESLGSTVTNIGDLLRALHAIDLPQLCLDISQFKDYAREWERTHGKSRRVFCHNDSQYGNLLKLRLNAQGQLPLMASGMRRDGPGSPSPASPGGSRRSRSRSRSAQPHQRLVVIDFEYASPNPRAYDIANHFHEWRADYHDAEKSWSLEAFGAYPTQAERRQWLLAYVDQGRALTKLGRSVSQNSTPDSLKSVTDMALPPSVLATNPVGVPGTPRNRDEVVQAEVDRLEEEVHVWSPAPHALWGLWGIVYARDDIVTLLDHAQDSVVPDSAGQLQYRPTAELLAKSGELGSAENFDNLKYSLGRFEMLRAELRARQIGLRH